MTDEEEQSFSGLLKLLPFYGHERVNKFPDQLLTHLHFRDSDVSKVALYFDFPSPPQQLLLPVQLISN